MNLNFGVPKNYDGELVHGLIMLSKNKASGAILIESESQFDWTDDYTSDRKLTTLVRGDVSALTAQVESLNLKPADSVKEKLGTEMSIRVLESTTPFYPNQTPKRKGADGSVITLGGKPIYRETKLVRGEDTVHQKLKGDGEMSWADYEATVAAKVAAAETVEDEAV